MNWKELAFQHLPLLLSAILFKSSVGEVSRQEHISFLGDQI